MTDDVSFPGFVYRFPAVVDRWIDGDTVVVHRGVSPGKTMHGEHIRVANINAPELSQAGGAASRDHANQLAPPGTKITLLASQEEKYGRFLAVIVLPDGTPFDVHMIQDGFALPYKV